MFVSCFSFRKQLVQIECDMLNRELYGGAAGTKKDENGSLNKLINVMCVFDYM